ncbi:uroporphyrinogen-III C-methyltransferase [Pedobacter sp. JCM 36344]|uniref:uroporphyrinogen-III C-methyltransferase n=1 Tax=Pedobacter sp. JCM 36344 TaxID=3374280 RepID=UPI00397DD252
MDLDQGDPELMTLKGVNILKRADAILYDNLSSKILLEYAPKDCILVYVGKKPYEKHNSQEEIYEMIKFYATDGKIVVRLKGGDPYIFGRGYEEMLFAEENGIKAHYIPGISSMQGAGLSNIPLTHRGVSESIWMITGTKKDGSLSADLQCAMNSGATVVIYMGMRKLQEISSAYIRNGLGSMPAAIIQHASLPQEKQAVCMVKDLQEVALQEKLSHPAIIIIGNVVQVKKAIKHSLSIAS